MSLINNKTLCYGFKAVKDNKPVFLSFEIGSKPYKYPLIPILVISHEALKLLGGFDERFIGCGMETMEFLNRSIKLKTGEMHILSDYMQNKYLHYIHNPAIRGIFDLIPEKNVETEKLLEYMENKKYISTFRPVHDVK